MPCSAALCLYSSHFYRLYLISTWLLHDGSQPVWLALCHKARQESYGSIAGNVTSCLRALASSPYLLGFTGLTCCLTPGDRATQVASTVPTKARSGGWKSFRGSMQDRIQSGKTATLAVAAACCSSHASPHPVQGEMTQTADHKTSSSLGLMNLGEPAWDRLGESKAEGERAQEGLTLQSVLTAWWEPAPFQRALREAGVSSSPGNPLLDRPRLG